eukprot:2616941-Prymnesium_polylepis.1
MAVRATIRARQADLEHACQRLDLTRSSNASPVRPRSTPKPVSAALLSTLLPLGSTFATRLL